MKIKKEKTVVYIHDFCFFSDENKDIYTGASLQESYFDRFFCSGFDNVNLVTRNKREKKSVIESVGYSKVISDKISLPVKIDNYLYLLNPLVLIKILIEIKKADILVINFPSVIGLFVWFLAKLINKKYVLEIAADKDQFNSKKFGFVLTFVFGLLFSYITKSSSGSIFVSNYLMKKYPCSNSLVASNVNISCHHERELLSRSLSKVNVLFVGGVNKRKGVGILINSIKLLVDRGYDINVKIAGGHFDDDYNYIIDHLNLKKNITLLGLKTSQELEVLYKDANIYVQPSLSEGIPRATIEALSFSLPCIATRLPGFYELLPEENLVSVSDSIALANKIESFINDIDLYNKNISNSKLICQKYLYELLHEKRVKFYSKFL